MPRILTDTARFELRLPPELKARLSEAAAVQHQSLAAFLISAGEREANRVLSLTPTAIPRAPRQRRSR